MNRCIFFATLLAASACAAQTPSAHNTVRIAVHAPSSQATAPAVVAASSPAVLQASAVQTQLAVGSDGNTYVGLWVDAPPPPQAVAVQRAPMDVALVIDVSGSMAGPGITNARAAAASFIENLADGDIVSVYAFSNSVYEIAPPTRVDAQSRADLVGRVSALQTLGGTNMYDGLRAGEAQLARAPATHPIRRVVMISDGMANIGPSSPEELGTLAAQGTEYGAQVTAIGVGLQYDERTLNELVVRSSGRLYHLEQPAQMAAILQSEFNLLATTVAANAYIEVVPAPGVVLEGLEGARIDREGNALRIPVGSLYGGQRREVLLRARLDTGRPGVHSLGAARLVYTDPLRQNAPRRAEVALNYTVTPDARAVSASVNDRVRAMVTTYEAAQAQLRAAQHLNQGQSAQAVATLDRAEAQLRAAASTARSDQERERLNTQAAAVRRVRVRAATATSAPAARGAALEANHSAMDAMGH